jgi:hypothetical protein
MANLHRRNNLHLMPGNHSTRAAHPVQHSCWMMDVRRLGDVAHVSKKSATWIDQQDAEGEDGRESIDNAKCCNKTEFPRDTVVGTRWPRQS